VSKLISETGTDCCNNTKLRLVTTEKNWPMENLERIKQEIESLPKNDFIQLRNWFSDKAWKKWDRQIEEDSISGKLDFLMKEALEEKDKGKLRIKL
jgi:hypothetical protein